MSIKNELKRLRKELEFIKGQLENENCLEPAGLSELSSEEIDELMYQNEVLMAEVLELENLLKP